MFADKARKGGAALALAMTLMVPAIVHAGEDVQLFRSVPTVDELRNTLAPAKRKIKSRGITFGGGAADTQPEQNAKPGVVGMLINFEFGSVKVLPDSFPYLNQVGKLMQQEGNVSLVIEGHTDAVGSFDSNMVLSERRAEAVRNYLIDAFGIAPERLSTTGKGESTPLVADPNAADNRRVQFRSEG